MKNKIPYIITAAIIVRLCISLFISDGTVLSDGITYLGAVVNISSNGSVAAILPEDDSNVKGKTVTEILDYLRELKEPNIRLLSYQWFHSVFFTPFLLLFPSVYFIIFLNNILLIAAGYFLFSTLKNVYPSALLLSWLILLFYPPLFYSTSSFYSEPLFIFLFSLLWRNTFIDENFSWISFLAAVALSITRPIGSVYILLFAFFFFTKKMKKEMFLSIASILTALVCNFIIMHHNITYEKIADFPSLGEAIYLSNSPMGNGDLDNYLTNPELSKTDSVYFSFKNSTLTTTELLKSLAKQITGSPLSFLRNTINKLLNMFFGIIPDSWIYGKTEPQSLLKKGIWFAITFPLWICTYWGIKKQFSKSGKWYIIFFGATLLLQILILARLRYLLPLIVVGIPFAAHSIAEITKNKKLFG